MVQTVAVQVDSPLLARVKWTVHPMELNAVRVMEVRKLVVEHKDSASQVLHSMIHSASLPSRP